jgi:hypothetical protein
VSLADLERNETASEDLKDMVDDWIQVIDRWVRDVDRGMGGAADGAGLAEMPDSAPEPMRAAKPTEEAG